MFIIINLLKSNIGSKVKNGPSILDAPNSTSSGH
jgi:hypothetical protein